MKVYKCAIIGLTNIASAPIRPSLDGLRLPLPYSHASALARIPNAQVVAVCDIVPALTERFGELWSATWENIHIYSDFQEMLAQEEIDILSVCTPDNKHTDIVIAASDHGVPAILCEKPMATSLAEADRIVAAVEKAGTVFSVEHTRRWDPYYHQAKELIDAGRIGQVRTIVGTDYEDRAMIFRNGTHVIDLMCYFAKATPTHVFAKLEEGYEDYAEYRGDGGHDPRSEPGASAYIQFANGVRGFFSGVKGVLPNSEYDIVGTEGRIRINESMAELWTKEAGTNAPVCHPFPATMVMTGAIQAAFEEIIDVLERGGTTRSTARDARMTVQILEGMLASQQRGNCLVVL